MGYIVDNNHPPPTKWQDFQRLSLDLYKKEYPNSVAKEYGSDGQSQFGIDVLIRNENRDRNNCLQCKCVEKFSCSDLRAEVEKTNRFEHNIWRYALLVTVKVDRNIQEEAAKLTYEKGFLIEVRFWREIAGSVARHSDLAKIYLSYATTHYIEVESLPSASLIEVTLHQTSSVYSFVVTRLSHFERFKNQGEIVLLTGLQGKKLSGYYKIGGGHWSDFFESVVPFRLDAYAVWK